MATTKEIKGSKLPRFANEREAGEFWDSHSPEEFPEEFKEVEVRFSRPLIKRGLTIKLSEDTLSQLKVIAKAQGIGPSTLVRMWILEHLRHSQQ